MPKSEIIEASFLPIADAGCALPGELPEWLPIEAWDGFVEMREEHSAPWSANAARRIIMKLSRLRDDGEDLVAMLNQSVISGWRGVFPARRRH